MIEKIVVYSIGIGIETVILMLGLLVMLRLQKLKYSFLGLMASAIVCSGLDMIPYVGHYVAVVALYVCLIRLTHADLFPDLLFAVGLSYGLLLCLNIYVVKTYVGDIHALARARGHAPTEAVAGKVTDDKTLRTGAMKYLATVVGWFHRTPASGANQSNPGASSSSTNLLLASSTNTVQAKPIDPQAAKLAGEVSRNFSLKGVSKSPSEAMAIIHSGVKNYTIAEGESMSMETPKGKVTVRCESVDEKKVVLDVSGIDVAVLHRASAGVP